MIESPMIKILLLETPVTAKQIGWQNNKKQEKKTYKLRNLAKEKTIEIMKKMLENKKSNKNYEIQEANITEKEIDEGLITSNEAFLLYQSYGFPKDMIIDLAIEKEQDSFMQMGED